MLSNTCISCDQVRPLNAHGATDDQRLRFKKLIESRQIADIDACSGKIVPPWKPTGPHILVGDRAYNTTIMSLMLHHPTAFSSNLLVEINQKYYVNDDPSRITHYCVTEGVGYCASCFKINHESTADKMEGGVFRGHSSVMIDHMIPTCSMCCIDQIAMYAIWFCPQCNLHMCHICAIVGHAKQQGASETAMTLHDVHIMSLQERVDYYKYENMSSAGQPSVRNGGFTDGEDGDDDSDSSSSGSSTQSMSDGEGGDDEFSQTLGLTAGYPRYNSMFTRRSLSFFSDTHRHLQSRLVR